MSRSYWIWHYGEYEIYHSMMLNLRRQEFGADLPPFWKVSAPYVVINFEKHITAQTAGYLIAHTTGKGYIKLDGVGHPMGQKVIIPPGEHTVVASVFKTDGLPALFVESDICPSNSSWQSNDCAGESAPVGWDPYFDSADKDPQVFPFCYEHKEPVACERINGGLLYDFGNEFFGLLNIENAVAADTLAVFYGESREEALDTAHSVLLETVQGQTRYRLRQRAFRYIFIENAADTLAVSMEYEYLPLTRRGTFACDNPLFNAICEASVHTFHLNCREGFLDGIKRDRWMWSGDAFQSARINNYLFADPAIIRRSALGLIGKPPIEQHINGIVDYSMLWIIGLHEFYLTYGDADFVRRAYPLAEHMLAFCETRLNEEGFIVGKGSDWTFIDWSDIDKTGAVCAEQILLVATYNAMGALRALVAGDAGEYRGKAEILKQKVDAFYWDKAQGGFIDSYESGQHHITRHANIFAVMFDIASREQTQSILQNVLKNPAVTKITTPYFKGYELDVLAKLGEYGAIEAELTSYWGEMLKCGATTIWEEFDPTRSGVEHYAMYGNKYTKSLCHAWGAGPVYLFGRYYLGVYPTSPGFKTFTVKPNLGGLSDISGTVPAADGAVTVRLNKERLSVLATLPGGTLVWQGQEYALEPGKELVIER